MSAKERHAHFANSNQNTMTSVLKQSNEKLAKDLKSAKIQIDLLEQKNEILEERILSVKNDYNEIDADHNALQSEFSSSQSILSDHETTKLQNEQYMKDIEEMNQTINALQTENRHLTQQRDDNHKKLKQFLNQTKKQESIINDLNQKCTSYEHKLNDYQNQMEEQKQIINDQNNKISQLKEERRISLKMRNLSRSSSDESWAPSPMKPSPTPWNITVNNINSIWSIINGPSSMSRTSTDSNFNGNGFIKVPATKAPFALNYGYAGSNYYSSGPGSGAASDTSTDDSKVSMNVASASDNDIVTDSSPSDRNLKLPIIADCTRCDSDKSYTSLKARSRLVMGVVDRVGIIALSPRVIACNDTSS